MRTTGPSIAKIAILGIAGLVAAGPALALTPQETAAFRRKCSGDYNRLCSAYEPDSPQVQECFRAKMKELSGSCRDAIAAQERGGRGR
jgi:hypothetical protein